MLTLRGVLRAEWSDGLVLILRVPPRLVQVGGESWVTGADGDHVQGEAQAELAVNLDLILDPEVDQTRISATCARHEK